MKILPVFVAMAVMVVAEGSAEAGGKKDIVKLKRKLAMLESRVDRQAQLVNAGLVPVNGVCVDVCAFDSDADGLGDCVDPCPCDPTNLDTDGDAIPDCIDPCPADPLDACVLDCDDLYIPEGHLPPPGECKVWFPDRDAGHQPPPGSCEELSRTLPPGACLIHGG